MMRTPSRNAFTIIELLVAAAVLAVVLGIMLSIVNQTSAVWRKSGNRIEAFQSARMGFEIMTSALSQATLNAYWDYQDQNGNFRGADPDFEPDVYGRRSELHFLVLPAGTEGMPGTAGCGQAVFFQTPLNRVGNTEFDGLGGLLNACGFFVEYGSVEQPGHVEGDAVPRFQLMQWMQTSEGLDVYANPTDWIEAAETEIYPIADNIVALFVWPREKESDAPALLNAYDYDSRDGEETNPQPVTVNQLPPIVQIAMVAIDASSAARLGDGLADAVAEWTDGLFTENPASRFAEDLETLNTRIRESDIPVEHRIFQANIPLQESKWSAL